MPPDDGTAIPFSDHVAAVKEARASAPRPKVVSNSGEEAPSEWRFFSPREFDGRAVPKSRFIVDQWLGCGHVTLNFGDGGTGKTLLMQQLATSSCTSQPWCGLAVEQCVSIALFCEDDEAELHRRQEAINREYGVDYSDLSNMIITSGVGCDNTLVEFDADGRMHETAAFRTFMKQAKAVSAKLVCIDTAADTFGGNENVRREVRQFVGKALGHLAHETGAAVLLNAHPSRTGMGSAGDQDGGSTAWSNTARSRWSLARPKADEEGDTDPDARVLTRRKSNYARIGDTIRLRWQRGVLIPVDAPTSFEAATKHVDADATFLELLARFQSNGIRVSESKHGKNWAPKMFGKAPDRNGFTLQDFEKAMNRLFAGKQIKVHDFGRKGRPEPGIAAADFGCEAP